MDSRECPGPSSEVALYRPSPRRVLTAGAIALAAVVPALDPIESPAESANVLPPLLPARAESAALDAANAFQVRAIDARRASRSAARRAAVRAHHRPAGLLGARVSRPDRISPARKTALLKSLVRARWADPDRSVTIRPVSARPVPEHRAGRSAHPFLVRRGTYRSVVTRHAVTTRSTQRVMLPGGMSAVIAYARSQVGRRYVTGGEGGGGFDCSGLTKRAYAQAGIELPHSSWAQAARAHHISRRQARPGDLVVGPGHVGIYMGHGMMIDAGNHRTGVVYRRLFSGLRVGRL